VSVAKKKDGWNNTQGAKKKGREERFVSSYTVHTFLSVSKKSKVQSNHHKCCLIKDPAYPHARMARNKMVMVGVGTYGIVTGATYLYLKDRKGGGEVAAGSAVVEATRRGAFSAQAKCYDNQVGLDETLMGVNLLRYVR
jgi:hypothetical protein